MNCTMKRLKHFILFSSLVLLLCAPACKKSGGGTNNNGSLTIQTTPASGSVQAPAPGPTFSLTVTVTSAMPSGGVTIDVVARPDGSTTPFFSTSVTNSNTTNTFTITGAPSAIVSVVDITVTDVSNPSTKATA